VESGAGSGQGTGFSQEADGIPLPGLTDFDQAGLHRNAQLQAAMPSPR
jgi:hypothetical protein